MIFFKQSAITSMVTHEGKIISGLHAPMQALEHHRGVKKLHTYEHLALGALSGACAATATMPLDCAKTALQCGVHASLGDVLSCIVREHGARGLFAGMVRPPSATSLTVLGQNGHHMSTVTIALSYEPHSRFQVGCFQLAKARQCFGSGLCACTPTLLAVWWWLPPPTHAFQADEIGLQLRTTVRFPAKLCLACICV